MSTQKEHLRATIGLLEYVIMLAEDNIALSNRVYVTDEDKTLIKMLIDCCVRTARLVTYDDVTELLRIYINGREAIARNSTGEGGAAVQHLDKEVKLIRAFLDFRAKL